MYDPGEAKRGPPMGTPPTGCVHSRQNLAAAGGGAPRASHRALSGAPHSRQNFASCGSAVRHRTDDACRLVLLPTASAGVMIDAEVP